LVALVAGDTVGSKLKERQYEQATYAGTELGLDIAPIAEHVRKRLDRLGSGTAVSRGGGA
jgi:predicted nucleotidyltransferase